MTDEPEQVMEVFAEMGRSVVALVSASRLLGHATPAMTVDYLHPTQPDPVVDLVEWCRQMDGWQEARDRLLRWMDDTGLTDGTTGLMQQRAAALVP